MNRTRSPVSSHASGRAERPVADYLVAGSIGIPRVTQIDQSNAAAKALRGDHQTLDCQVTASPTLVKILWSAIDNCVSGFCVKANSGVIVVKMGQVGANNDESAIAPKSIDNLGNLLGA